MRSIRCSMGSFLFREGKKTVGGAKQALSKYRWQIDFFLILKSKKGNPATYPIHFQFLRELSLKLSKITCIPLSLHIKLQEGLSALFIVIAQSRAYNNLVNSMIAVTTVLNTFHHVPPYLAKSSHASGFLVQRFSSFRVFLSKFYHSLTPDSKSSASPDGLRPSGSSLGHRPYWTHYNHPLTRLNKW